jgi:hypothetical protein
MSGSRPGRALRPRPISEHQRRRSVHFGESADSPTSMFYRGSSMSPTLTAPALLRIAPYGEREVQCGDVIVFCPPQSDEPVVHRVVARDARGIRTRGDACADVDPYLLGPEHIIGQVVYVHRRGKEKRIHGGRRGRVIGRWLRIRRALTRGLVVPLRSVYRLLGRSGIFRIWIPARLQPRILAFNRVGGRELHLFMGRRLIGRLEVGDACWRITPPYRLFVNELDLPRGDHEHPPVSSDPPPRSRSNGNSCPHPR